MPRMPSQVFFADSPKVVFLCECCGNLRVPRPVDSGAARSTYCARCTDKIKRLRHGKEYILLDQHLDIPGIGFTSSSLP